MSTPPPDPAWRPPPTSAGYPDEPYYAPGWGPPPPPTRRRRRPMVVLAVVAGVVLLALVAAAVVRVNLWLQTRPVEVAIDAPREVNAQQVDVGHCIGTLPDDGDVGRVRLVPCDTPHDAEVVSAVELTAPWPGQEQVDERVAAACRLSTAEREAGLVPMTWSPTQQSWRQGDRVGLCLAVEAALTERR